MGRARFRCSLGVVALSAILVLSGLVTSAAAQQMTPCDFQSQGDYSGSYAKVSTPGPYSIAEQEIVELDSELDGVTIQMGIVRPEVPAGTQVPVIVIASSYYHPLQTMDLRACKPFLTENFVPHGYAVVLLAIRGTADAGGCMNLMGPGERADIDQAITWLGTQPWSNGSVGMIGKSYDGATQWEAASFGNPYLKTIVPISGVPDIFELMYGNGLVDWRAPGILNGIYYAESAGFYAPGRSPEHTVEVTACPEYGVGMAASAYSSTTGELDPLGYYAERRYKDEVVKNYRGSVYLVQGLQDWNVNPGQQFPWIYELEKRGVYVKYLMGQWGHSWPYDNGSRMDWADVILEWFDRWLKGDRGADLGPRVEVEDSNGQWRRADSWLEGRSIKLYLAADGSLSERPSTEEASKTIGPDPFHLQGGYTNDVPLHNEACPPNLCAAFDSKPFPKDFRIAGSPRVKLTVTPTGPGGQLSIYLYAKTDEGMERIGWGQFDLRFRDGSDSAQEVVPGEDLKVSFDVQPLDALIQAGAWLYVTVSGGTAWNRLPSYPNYPMELAVGKGASGFSFVSPEPSPSDFFKPPDTE